MWRMSVQKLDEEIIYLQGDAIHKGVFIVFFQGEQLKNRVRKICEG